MNALYFACPARREYIDAGYRWAYLQLVEPKLVVPNEAVDVDAVLATTQYWEPPDDERNAWPCERILPRVRAFLETHCPHGVLFVDEDTIVSEESLSCNWQDVSDADICSEL